MWRMNTVSDTLTRIPLSVDVIVTVIHSVPFVKSSSHILL